MHYFLFLRLQGFYARALRRPDGKSIVVHRDKRVLDVNVEASKKLVYCGMTLAEAKAILQEGSFVAWQEEPYRQAQSEWLDLCAEISDVVEPAEQHSAWIDLSSQPDAEALTSQLIRSIEERFGLSAYAGFGPSKWIARLAAEMPYEE